MIVYSRSATGWFIILIFHGRIMFITIGEKKCCPVSILNMFFKYIAMFIWSTYYTLSLYIYRNLFAMNRVDAVAGY